MSRGRRRQAERFADRDAQIYANRAQAYSSELQPAPAAPPQEDQVIAQLTQLGDLKEQGVLTEEEFVARRPGSWGREGTGARSSRTGRVPTRARR